MDHVMLGTSGLAVSRVCLGAMNFGTPGWGCDRDDAAAIVTAFRDAGGDFFDTADVYGAGASEEILGSLLTGVRDEVVIASKVGLPTMPGPNGGGMSAKHIHASVDASLRRLGTDYIDLYQLHHFDNTVPLEESLGTMDDLVHAGKVRYVGCSNYFAWQVAQVMGVAQARGLTQLVSVQMMYNLIRRDIEREHVECADRLGIGLIAYGPLHSGLLAGGWTELSQIPASSRIAEWPSVYLGDGDRAFTITAALVEAARGLGATPGQLALAWVLGQPGIACVLTAAQRPEELTEQLRALELDIPPDAASVLDTVSALPVSYPTDFYERLHSRQGT